MTERYYNAPLGAKLAQDVAEGAADTSVYTAFRVTYDATGNSKEATLLALDAIRMAVEQDNWPPA
jgi:20S proteasome alpha/beta subunit